MKKQKHTSYTSLMRTVLAYRMDKDLQLFLLKNTSDLLKKVKPFEDDEISESMTELIVTIDKAREKYRKNVSSEIRRYRNRFLKCRKVSA